WQFWNRRGNLREGLNWMEKVLDKGNDLSPELRAALLSGAGNLARSQHNYAAAEAHLTESLALSKTLSDGAGVRRALNNLGLVSFSSGDYAAARAYLLEGLAAARAAGNTEQASYPLSNLG